MSQNNRSQMPAPPVSTGGDSEQPQPIKKNDPIKSLHSRKGPIEVIALENGLYKGRRIIKGEQFKIESPKHLGSWMKCVDKTIQAEHEVYCKAHKQKFKEIDRLSAGN